MIQPIFRQGFKEGRRIAIQQNEPVDYLAGLVRTFTHNRFELISFFSCQGNDVFFHPPIFGEAARVYNGLRPEFDDSSRVSRH